MLQHATTRYNTLRYTAIHCNSKVRGAQLLISHSDDSVTLQHAATHCTMQHTATHCNTLPHAAIPCNTLQHTATHCNTLQQQSARSAIAYLSKGRLCHTATRCNTLCNVTYCNTLPHAATRCNTLQHTATHCNSEVRGAQLLISQSDDSVVPVVFEYDLQPEQVGVLLCVAVCRSVSQCVAVCCSVLQCVAVCVVVCCSACCI